MKSTSIELDKQTRICDHDFEITLSKIFTPNGERLQIDSQDGDRTTRLDAVNLESIAWQEPGTFDISLEDSHFNERIDDAVLIEPTDEGTTEFFSTISNEFAEVDLFVVETTDGTRLQIEATKLDYSVWLNGAALAFLSRQNWKVLSRFLESPLGLE